MATSTTVPNRSGLWSRLTGLAYLPPEAEGRRSLVAASKRISRAKITRGQSSTEAWQQEAIELYSEVGELRYVANVQANAASRAEMFVGRWEPGATEPTKVEGGLVEQVWDELGGGPLGRSEMVKRLFVQLFVPGDGYLIGIPRGMMETGELPPGGLLNLRDMDWNVYSATEVQVAQGKVTINVGVKPFVCSEDHAIVVRVWRPNPFRWWQADSPCRATLPILREIVGLTKHVSATIDSRLAGAGMLLIGDSFSLLAGQSPDPDDTGESDPILAALMDAMLTAIKDRDSASAVMPIMLQGPDEAIDKVKHLTFTTPFDSHTKDLRDEAIRRLALALDAPPEILLGMATSNHWNAWIIHDDAIKTHIEPALALIADALTRDYLWPVLEAAGVSDFEMYAVWWDTSGLAMRSDRSKEAIELFDRGQLTSEALRRENGFDEADAPEAANPAVEMALGLIKQAPSLLGALTISQLVKQIQDALDGIVEEMPEPAPEPEPEVVVVEQSPEADELPTQDAPEQPTEPLTE